MTKLPGLSHRIPLPYGSFAQFLRDPLAFQLRVHEQFGDVYRYQIGPLLVHFLYHPDHVQHVLQDRQKDYPRGWHYRLLRRMLGNNLVVSEGDFWRRQRRLAQPAFHRQRLAGFADVMVDATCQMLTHWDEIAAADGTVDIGSEMSQLALSIAGRTLFSRDVSHAADAVGASFTTLSRHLERRFNQPVTTPPLWLPTPDNRRAQEALRTLNRVVLELIQARRREGGDRGDLLSMLMQARNKGTGEAMSDEELRSEVLTFLIAGHETTATALTWTWFLLARHPAVRLRLRQEVCGVVGDGLPTVEDVPHLLVTRMILEESMRLYPPIWAISRQSARDDEIGGYHIPAGSTVLVSQFVTHRHPDFWDQPEVFDPDRFAPGAVAQRPRYAHFPFLGGPHQCIGSEFAMLEMRLVVATVAQRFDLDLVPGQDIQPRASLALRPSAPVRMRLRPVS